LLALLACYEAASLTHSALAATSEQQALIEAIFGDQPGSEALDANGDGALTVADIILLGSIDTLFSGTIAELLPHALHDKLVYRVTSPTGHISTETTIVTTADFAGTFVIDDQEVSGAQVVKHETQSYADSGSNLIFTGGSDVVRDLSTICTPPLLRMTVPVVANQVFSTTSRCNVRMIRTGVPVGFIDRTDTFTPIATVDSITVSAGTYGPVLYFTGVTNLSGEVETDDIYIAPGIGAILRVSTVGGQTTRVELSGGIIGGIPVKQ
jgi:hypothetical protein